MKRKQKKSSELVRNIYLLTNATMPLPRVPTSSIIWWSNLPLLNAENTFTNFSQSHSTYGNTTGNRYTQDKYKTKNAANAWGVEWAVYTDPDWALVGSRKWALWGYPLKDADGSIGGFESFITCEFPTYDWVSTYTKSTRINSELTVGTQDRTGAWTSYTPVVSWSGWWTVGGTSMTWRYKLIWKTCHCQISGDFSKWTLSGRVYFSLPVAAWSLFESAVSWILGVIWTGVATSYWYSIVSSNNLEFLAWTWTAWSRASLSAATLTVRAYFTYETA